MTFKNSIGAFYLQALFYETTGADKSTVLYTLKDRDHQGFPSLHRLYLETNDPTEHTFAVTYLDGWAHWERLCECDWFTPYLDQMRKELDLRIKAQALSRILSIANSGAKEALTANRFLLETDLRTASQERRGRPKKNTKRVEAQKLSELKELISEDAKRLELN